MGTIPPTCSKCGQHIIGIKRSYAGKTYCDSCYQELMHELEIIEEQKNDLYTYITQLFGLSECPDVVIYAIDKSLASGKKISGIKATIWWFYEISRHEANNVLVIGKIINEQYENARQYVAHMKKIQQENERVDLNNIPTQNVTIHHSRTKKWTPKYRMEDL